MAENKKKTKKYQRYNRLWRRIAIRTVIDALSRKYNVVTERDVLPEGANLILANHVTVGDQFIMLSHFPKDHMYYVAGEDALKKPLFRWVGEHILSVLVHMRGVDAIKTTKVMLRHLKAGANVTIHPEGATSFDGKTRHVDDSISKLAKMGDCNLVLIRFEGGYLTQPRWRNEVCKGKISLHTKVITREELKQMKAPEVSEAVNQWIYTDAYEEQKREKTAFNGKVRCKGLEACIYRCPQCGKIGYLRTTDNSIYCTCGFEATYDEYGYLHQKDGSTHTITQWCDEQKAFLASMVSNGGEIFLFEDEYQVNKVWHNATRQSLGKVKLKVYTDHVEYALEGKEGTLALSDVENVFIFRRNQWNCHINGKEYRYELIGDFSSNALKYQDLWNILN